MVTAVVLLEVERGKTNEVAETIAGLDGVSEVYSVAGRYDLAVMVRVRENEQLASVVTEKIRNIQGITKSETLIAFRAYSKYDIEMAFSGIGDRKSE
jgi:DNA-binding Lrp family transcriptional regulator